MNRCFSARWLAVLAVLGHFTTARATTVIAPEFDRMVGSSDYIVRAVVKSVASQWRDNPDKPGSRYIGTLVELEVKEVIKGSPPSPLVLDLVGGRVGDRQLTIEGAPHFGIGEENILFIKGNGRQIIPLVGMSHGQYPVRRDKVTGQDQVMRSNGKPLYDVKEISLPEAALRAAPARDPRARTLSADEFATRIRQSSKYSPREKLE
jgi:hypothetical protein